MLLPATINPGNILTKNPLEYHAAFIFQRKKAFGFIFLIALALKAY